MFIEAKPLAGHQSICVCCHKVTVDDARRLLEVNYDNRKVSIGVVARYANEMSVGGWVLGIDPICISQEGVLLNGQHRLLAVIKSGVAIDAIFLLGVSQDSFRVMDRGRVRSLSFALGMSQGLAAMARLLAVTRTNMRIATDKDVEECAEFIEPAYAQLIGDGLTSRKGVTAAVRLGVILRRMESGSDYPLEQIRAFSHDDIGAMSPRVLAAWKAMNNNGGALTKGARGEAGQRADMVAAWSVFDPDRASTSRVVLNGAADATSSLHAFIARCFE